VSSPLDKLTGPGGALATEPPDPAEFQGLKDSGPEVWRILDRAHTMRNLGEYEGHLDIDERFVADLVTAAQKVAAALD
jgi:hypothetical protein